MFSFRDKHYSYHKYLSIDLTTVFAKNLDIDKAINNLDVLKHELKKLKRYATKLNLVLHIDFWPGYEGNYHAHVRLGKKLGDKRDMRTIRKELNSKLVHMNYYKMFEKYD